MLDELRILLKRPRRKYDFDLGDHEEAATLGLLVIKVPSHILTVGYNTRIKKRREGPLVSGYPIAEWFAWNWWRLTSEIGGRPTNERAARRWDFSHRLSTIGSGYDWPNISIYSDGYNSYLDSTWAVRDSVGSFEYFDSSLVIVSTKALEEAMSKFINDTIKSLNCEGIRHSNLYRIWSDLTSEQANRDDAFYRAMEARLGFDPDELDEKAIIKVFGNAESIGPDALNEVAADEALAGNSTDDFPSIETFQNASNEFGSDVLFNSMATLSEEFSSHSNGKLLYGKDEAWRIGKKLAGMLRSQEKLNGQNISNCRLAQYAGVNKSMISDASNCWEKMSFCLNNKEAVSKLTLRPKWETGRRFGLARLVGDRVARKYWGFSEERLSPATSTSSYRQRLQRAFAAELLCPIDYIDEITGKNYSLEMQKKAANEFNVSEQVVFWQIWNNYRIGELSISEAF